MMKMKDWKLEPSYSSLCSLLSPEGKGEEKFIARGRILGDPMWPEDVEFYTKIIKEIKCDEENKHLILITESKEDYELSPADMEFNYFEQSIFCLESLQAPVAFLKECEKEKEKATVNLLATVDTNLDLLDKVDSILQNNELYLQLKDVYVQKAFYKNDKGKVKEVHVSAHIGMTIDSYLVGMYDKENIDFRYFDKMFEMEPYVWSENIHALVIEMLPKDNIMFLGSEKKIACRVGEAIRIKRDDVWKTQKKIEKGGV